ncbi:phosphoacetylglucosamine mutase, putative [Trypanosoma equiperdum]|uniref:Phosphoacetylglucosamine mutase n=2 Tax=Trypanozoon TaxID=39700 RepID=Q57XH7_TRYB2|nr:phosphoacetylglucosamine mutase, putative [Trypanosoma brucei brucei TREU927]AAX69692.1 phosphoacetylglucosamine mutase, putative [Trypanosoma brucei]AAZ12869.1 phosphoacetylglucosamine mutase, putative [Trypanosoma brucei brucei TREU927]SCU64561.1 phosphoacetylglucosamine mutase, putative [Trypanosoma equiperdum]
MVLQAAVADAICAAVAKYPLLHDARVDPMPYGTSGFRTIGTLLPPVASRVVYVAVLRVWWAIKKGNFGGLNGCSVGCMVTASHNPCGDNGLKLIDVDGGMLETSWETTCTQAANASTGEELLKVLNDCINLHGLEQPKPEDVKIRCPFGAVHLSRDTRPTGVDILSAIFSSLQAIGVTYADHGVLTTPQLHYLVGRANREQLTGPGAMKPADFTSALYAKEVFGSLGELLRFVTEGNGGTNPRQRQKIVIDAASGVGAVALKSLLKCAQEVTSGVFEEFFDVTVLHDNVDDINALNYMCGADYTQKAQYPSNDTKEWAAAYEKRRSDKNEEVHYYSLDGDADRVVAFFHDRETGEDVWRLLDGDRISILYALSVREWIGGEALKLLDVGVVQTAYANGASTDYIQRGLGLRTYSSQTGVKNLHPIAHKCDIGAYFESNGHGTILLNGDAIDAKVPSLPSKTRHVLSLLPRLISQVCGDAIANVFACELILLAHKMSFDSWLRLYTDIPSTQLKVKVKNPKVITNTQDERRALTPPGLQEAIDAAVAAANEATPSSATVARAFARPSGTEPIVRVYAEAATHAVSSKLANDVEEIVRRFCGGA